MSQIGHIKLQNIPHLNLREQFYNHYHFVTGSELVAQLKIWRTKKVIKTPYISWYYWPADFFTYLSQMSIVGLESYTCGAVYDLLGRQGRLKENLGYVRNPYSIPGGRGTAEKYYVKLPSLASKGISLASADSELWSEVRCFYRRIRNPIFHGMQISSEDHADIVSIFELLADVYGWIDSWYDLDNVIDSASWVTKLKRSPLER